MKKITKYSKFDGFILMVKSTLKRFGFIKPFSGFYYGEKFLL